MNLFQVSNATKVKSEHRLKDTITFAGWAVVIIVALASSYQTIPTSLRTLLWVLAVFAAACSLTLAAVPMWQKVRAIKASHDRKGARQRRLAEFSEILQEARPLFTSEDGPFALRSYLMSLCSAFSQDHSLHPGLRCLHVRLIIITGWDDSLLKSLNVKQRTESEYGSIVLDIVSMYQAVSDIARELNSMELPSTPIMKGRASENRIIINKYNAHVDQLEKVLNRVEKDNPELRFGGFVRLL